MTKTDIRRAIKSSRKRNVIIVYKGNMERQVEECVHRRGNSIS